MQDAKHNQAVALLTGTEADVHLKVYREHLVIKNVSRRYFQSMIQSSGGWGVWDGI